MDKKKLIKSDKVEYLKCPTPYFLNSEQVNSEIDANRHDIFYKLQRITIQLDFYISVIEFFSFPDLSLKDRLLFTNFIKRIDVIVLAGSDLPLLEVLANYKIEYKLKLQTLLLPAVQLI